MLHHIAVGPVAKQPAGKSAPPLIVGAAAHVQLHERARFLDIFPWRGRLARLQPHDRITHAHRLARLQRQIAGQAVALVQQAQHGGSFGHRRAGHDAIVGGADRRAFHLDRPGPIGRRQGVIVAARCQRQGAGQHDHVWKDRRERPRRASAHAASGLHAS
ncbi:hypothetical protein RLDS_17705 [Sphingobium lactosutens DS20]|uniref:Uncharacterized protein n=1 Tax=Sphingobium lactosutens DS20 TaxID=1331060 RepID=T0H9Y2_9SPHN|nr:hypothetical protein RLDS_17705 [Sphingobium lactosutens DS20]